MSSENTDVEVVALTKGHERYVFIYDAASRAELLRVFGRYANSERLSFSWYDAAVLSSRVRSSSQTGGDIDTQ